MKKSLLYLISPYNNGAVFAEPKRAKLVDRINSAIESSKTWGEFRKAMPPAEYSEIVRKYDEDGEKRPRSGDAFDAEQLPGFSDGDYPPWLQREMETILPRSFFNKFGESVSTSNGDYWMIPETNLASACAALELLGYHIDEAVDLEFH